MEIENDENAETTFFGISKEQRKEIENLTEPTGLKSVDAINFMTEILKAIEEVKVSKDSIYIRTNKNFIFHSNNSISICENLNIQIAKQIHLNPVVKLFKKIQSKLPFQKNVEEEFMGGK